MTINVIIRLFADQVARAVRFGVHRSVFVSRRAHLSRPSGSRRHVSMASTELMMAASGPSFCQKNLLPYLPATLDQKLCLSSLSFGDAGR